MLSTYTNNNYVTATEVRIATHMWPYDDLAALNRKTNQWLLNRCGDKIVLTTVPNDASPILKYDGTIWKRRTLCIALTT